MVMILLRVPQFSMTATRRIEWPESIIYKNVRTTSGAGVKLSQIKDPFNFKLKKAGAYEQFNRVVTNALMKFEDIESTYPKWLSAAEGYRGNFVIGGAASQAYADAYALYPHIVIKTSEALFVSCKGAVADVLLEDCTLLATDNYEDGYGRNSFICVNCAMAPDTVVNTELFYTFSTQLPQTFINCMWFLPKESGIKKTTTAVLDRIGPIKISTSTVRFNHIGSRLAKELADVSAPTSAFLTALFLNRE